MNVVAANVRGSVSAAAPGGSATARLQSLDALRGLTIALMILVNTSGDGAHTWPILLHSPWNGLTLADVVFPCFLLMVGLSLVLSINGRLRRGVQRSELLVQALRRATILFGLGLALNGFPHYDLHTLRIFGVLQRIAICFLAASALYLWFRPRTLALLTFGVIAGYWVLLRWVPVPGYGVPTVDVPLLDPHGNLPAWLDRHLLPAAHLYHQGFYDPEGLLSSVGALGSTLVGVLAGVRMVRRETPAARARWLLLCGAACLVAGIAGAHWLPLNKRLWTSTFVLVNAGISLLTLALCLYWLDVRRTGLRWSYPLLVFGTNSLAAYALSEFLAAFLSQLRLPGSALSLQQALFHPLTLLFLDLHVAAFVYAVLYVAICYLPIWMLYRRGIFLKV